MKRDKFIVLPYSLHGKHISTFMGRIVQDPLDPLRRFVPEDYKNSGPDRICPGILEEPIAYATRADIAKSADTRHLNLVLTIYFALAGKLDTSESISKDGDLVKRYQMSQNTLRLERLLADPSFRAETLKLVTESKGKKLFFVVGFLTTEGTEWKLEGKESRLGVARGRVPVGPLTGNTPDLDVSAAVEWESNRTKNVTGRVEQEEIFAVAYDVLKPPHTSMLFRRNKQPSENPVLAGQFRATRDHLSLGKDESDEELDEDDGAPVTIDSDNTEDLKSEYVAWNDV